MTSIEFAVWFKGFSDAILTTPSQAQWDLLKKELNGISDPISLPIGVGRPNPTPMPLPHYPNPWDNPYKITCTTGSGTYNPSSDSITATPGYGSITYNPSTTTMWNPTGSLWSYTDALDRYNNWYWTNTTTPQQPTTGSNQLELEFEPK